MQAFHAADKSGCLSLHCWTTRSVGTSTRVQPQSTAPEYSRNTLGLSPSFLARNAIVAQPDQGQMIQRPSRSGFVLTACVWNGQSVFGILFPKAASRDGRNWATSFSAFSGAFGRIGNCLIQMLAPTAPPKSLPPPHPPPPPPPHPTPSALTLNPIPCRSGSRRRLSPSFPPVGTQPGLTRKWLLSVPNSKTPSVADTPRPCVDACFCGPLRMNLSLS